MEQISWSQPPRDTRTGTIHWRHDTDTHCLPVCGSVCPSVCTQCAYLSNCFPVCQWQLVCLTYVLLEQGWTLSCAAVGRVWSPVLVPPSSLLPCTLSQEWAEARSAKEKKGPRCPIVLCSVLQQKIKIKKTNRRMQWLNEETPSLCLGLCLVLCCCLRRQISH